MSEHNFSTKEGTIKAIIYECNARGLTLSEQHAYVIATVEHETANTFKPVKEAYWLSERWRKNNLRYYPYYGRGYVQLTWKENYKKYSNIINYDFVNDPDHVMDPNISLFILVHGFKYGTFTGKKLEDYVKAGKKDFYNARRCINGTDKAKHIASLADKYLKILGGKDNSVSSELKNDLPLLQKRDKSLGVKMIQKIFDLEPDGIFGNNTKLNVENFQTKLNQTADGIVGENTWRSLLDE